MRSPIPRFVHSMRSRSRRLRDRANRCIAPRSAAPTRTKCTSSAPIWTGRAWARPRTTMGPAPRWSWSWRAFSAVPMCRRIGSIRFVLWNNEEGSHAGSRAYAAQRAPLQGKEDPPGSGRYPEPKWLGMVQHDMVLWDHGMPRADGTVSPEQRPEADVNIEFQSTAKFADQAMKLAFLLSRRQREICHGLSRRGRSPHVQYGFLRIHEFVPAVSLRENERGMEIGAGWNPHYHQATDTLFRVFRQGFSAWLERRTDDTGGNRATGGCDLEEMKAAGYADGSGPPEPRNGMPGAHHWAVF